MVKGDSTANTAEIYSRNSHSFIEQCVICADRKCQWCSKSCSDGLIFLKNNNNKNTTKHKHRPNVHVLLTGIIYEEFKGVNFTSWGSLTGREQQCFPLWGWPDSVFQIYFTHSNTFWLFAASGEQHSRVQLHPHLGIMPPGWGMERSPAGEAAGARSTKMCETLPAQECWT